MKKLIFALLVVLIYSCGAGDSNKLNGHTNEQSEVDKPVVDLEPFKAFYKRFNTDTTFQLSHIAYPLAYLKADISSDKIDTLTIDEGQWVYVNVFSEDGESIYDIRYDANQNYFFVYQKGIGNSVSLTYYFKQQESDWILEKIENVPMQ